MALLLESESAKSEVQRHVTEFIVEPLSALFDELYAMSLHKDGRLLTFQMQLKAIPKWSAVTVSKWVDKLLKSCDCFEELVTALFLSHIKMLSAIRLGQATLKVKIPRNEKFIHAVMILAAKEFYENPRTFRTKSQAEKTKVLAFAVNKTVRDMLPMKNLLQEYLAQKPLPLPQGDDKDDIRLMMATEVMPPPPPPPPPQPQDSDTLHMSDFESLMTLAEEQQADGDEEADIKRIDVVDIARVPGYESEEEEEEEAVAPAVLTKATRLVMSMVAEEGEEQEQEQEQEQPAFPMARELTASAPSSVLLPPSTEEVLLDDILVNHPSTTAAALTMEATVDAPPPPPAAADKRRQTPIAAPPAAADHESSDAFFSDADM